MRAYWPVFDEIRSFLNPLVHATPLAMRFGSEAARPHEPETHDPTRGGACLADLRVRSVDSVGDLFRHSAGRTERS
jgi:hypothetical protein